MFKNHFTAMRNCIAIFVSGLILSLLTFEVEANSLSSSKSFRSGYGEPCNKTFRCTSQLWLACDRESSKCECAKPDEMIYDNKKQKCVVLIGERCKYGFDDEEIPTALWYAKAECVQNAVCGPSGLCSCPDGYYEDELLQQCSKLKGRGYNCKNSNECYKDNLLSCLDGQCQCDPDKAIYNPSPYGDVPSDICVGRAGSRCNVDNYYYAEITSYCIRNSICRRGICECESNYQETSDRLCGLGYNMDCSNGRICSDNFRCTGRNYQGHKREFAFEDPYSVYEEGRKTFLCECPHPQHQEFNSSSGKCRGLFGAPCNPHDSDSCKTGSVCNERDGIFQCEGDCGEGFVENLDGNCGISFGQPCNSNSVLNCDTKANLQCKDSICGCENDVDIYEHNRRQCSRPVGIRCNNDAECISNSICLISGNLLGRCACKEGYSVTKNHTCISEELIGLNESSEIDVTTPSMIISEGSGQIDSMALGR